MENLWAAYLGGGICMGLAALGGTLAIGNAISKAFESAARQPEVLEKIRPLIFIGIAFVESVVLYGLVISILLLTK